jgi:hypothetical protein
VSEQVDCPVSTDITDYENLGKIHYLMSRSRLRHFPFTLYVSPLPGIQIEYVDVIEVTSGKTRASITSKNIHLIADQGD